MPLGLNGGIIGLVNASTRTGGATGIWTLGEAGINSLAGLWPDDFSFVNAFTSSTGWSPDSDITSVDYVIIAGGGGGGARSGGGGGAGGFLAGSGLSVSSSVNYSLVVGSGGAGGLVPGATFVGDNGSNGSNMDELDRHKLIFLAHREHLVKEIGAVLVEEFLLPEKQIYLVEEVVLEALVMADHQHQMQMVV